LIRHAKSSWKELGLSDYERPLNERGRRNLPLMAAHFAQDVCIDHIITSGAKRALVTAKAFAKAVQCDLHVNDALYDASEHNLLMVIEQAIEAYDRVVIVGHNPSLTLVAEYLTGEYVGNIPTAGVFGMELVLPLTEGSAKKIYWEYPKKYGY
jgi:phosphohistidine phosphatase